ncbi:hypothetical protein ACIQU6_30405 [Streptomyces sp. NPDC090442]|uniref:hypothetical protein n=1 Tax=Streptomyces sp. NPDC090442 TaxID=3365962 RepID=UPI0037F96E11
MTNVVNSVSGNATIGGKLIQAGSLPGPSFTNGDVESGAVQLSAEQLDRTMELLEFLAALNTKRTPETEALIAELHPLNSREAVWCTSVNGERGRPFASALAEGQASINGPCR